MIRRLTLVGLGLLLLAGCGRKYQPTVRQKLITPTGTNTADAAVPPQTMDGPHGQPPGDSPPSNSPAFPLQPLAKAGSTGANSPAARQEPAVVESRDVQVGNLQLVAPEGWTRTQPQIPVIVAQFALPRVEGDSIDAQLTITSAGKISQAKLDGLRQQFREKAGEGSVTEVEIAGIKATLFDFSGTSAGPLGTATGVVEYRLLNALLPIGDTLYIVNCSGPKETMNAQAESFHAFLQTMKPSDSP